MTARNVVVYIAVAAVVLFLVYAIDLFGGNDVTAPTTAPPAAGTGTTR